MRKKNRPSPGFSGKMLLELYAAAFILLGPAFLDGAAEGWGLYAVFILTAAVFAVRLVETGKITVSVNILIVGLCAIWALLALFWAESLYLNIRLIFLLLTVVMAGMLAADYFENSPGRRLGERLTYLLAASAFVCASRAVITWAAFDGFDMAAPFAYGLGNSHILAGYMLVGLWCCARIYLLGKKRGRPALALAVPILFVFFMCRSLPAAMTGGLYALCCLFRRYKKSVRTVFAAMGAVAAAAVILGGELGGAALGDGLVSLFSHPGGMGGGGFTVRQGELQSTYYRIDALGTGADMASSLGVVGLAAAIAFIGWAAYLTVKGRSRVCALGAALCALGFFVPLGSSLGSLPLLMGYLVYGEWQLGKTLTLRLGNKCYIAVIAAAAIAVYGGVIGAAGFIKAAGLKDFENGDFRSAAEKFSTAAAVNPLDAESCYEAARAYRALYEQDGVKNDIVNAAHYAGLAVEKEPGRAAWYSEQAAIYASSGELVKAVETDRRAVELAPLWDDGRVAAAERLYGLISSLEKGSVTANRYYQELLNLQSSVTDIEKKKVIGDWADKAQPFTRPEYNYENIGGENAGDGEETEE